MINSKAWLSRYVPLLRSASQAEGLEAGTSQDTPHGEEKQQLLGENKPTDNEVLFSEIENLPDMEGSAWDWVSSSDDEDEETTPVYPADNDHTLELSEVKIDTADVNFIWKGGESSKKFATDCSDLKYHSKVAWRTIVQRTPYYIPILQWLPKYNVKQDLLSDILTGITVAAVVIPQSIAYTSLSFVPPVYGLYTAWMPMIIYFLFGTSRQLAIGPEGVISLLTGAAVTIGYNSATTNLYDYTVERALVLSFYVGIITLILGIFRVGFLDNLISRPILHGFVSASAAIIFIGQLDSFLGFSVEEQEWEKLIGVAENLDMINWPSTAIASASLISILVIDFTKRKLSPSVPPVKYIPTPLIIVIGAILVTAVFHLDEDGVVILGDVQSGFPVPTLPKFYDYDIFRDLIVEAVLIAIVGFVESNAIAKIYANLHCYTVSANRELVALGNVNFVSSFFGSYPAFGSLTRSKIANTAGARTPLFGFVASFIVLLTILFLMPAFYYLPKSAIAAIVMVAAARLIEFHLNFLWQIRAWKEIFLTFLTFITTFFLGAELGIIIAVAISLFLVVKHTTLPSVSVLGRTPNGRWRDLSVIKEAQVFPGILVIRIDESLYFGNIEQLIKMINRIVSLGKLDAHPTDPSVLAQDIFGLIIDARNIHNIDANAWAVLKEAFEDYQRRNIQICFAHLKDSHIRTMYQSGLIKYVPFCNLHNNVDSAVKFILSKEEVKSMDTL